MYCPACGADIKQQVQRYCQDCGATLPAAGGRGTSLVPRAPGMDAPVAGGTGRGVWLHLLPADMRNRMLLGAGAVVVAVFVLYVVINPRLRGA